MSRPLRRLSLQMTRLEKGQNRGSSIQLFVKTYPQLSMHMRCLAICRNGRDGPNCRLRRLINSRDAFLILIQMSTFGDRRVDARITPHLPCWPCSRSSQRVLRRVCRMTKCRKTTTEQYHWERSAEAFMHIPEVIIWDMDTIIYDTSGRSCNDADEG